MLLSKLSPADYGLMAAAPVKWLLDNEPDVVRAVFKFIKGERNTDYIDVALPPSWREMMRLRAIKLRRQKIELPMIRLKLKIVNDHISGVPHVMVTCSDEEMEAICGMYDTVMQKQQQTLEHAIRAVQ